VYSVGKESEKEVCVEDGRENMFMFDFVLLVFFFKLHLESSRPPKKKKTKQQNNSNHNKPNPKQSSLWTVGESENL